ncbi:MAG: DUF1993 domain-containing protein [Gammaproteobacteria bacterium TMED1]|jgi:hypothetical protein|nr:MAG: DUF1993 domain-containing protein [Gammaproteobacteria bacterium TMED1]|tara:strand:+ start:319 stop:846 length:528 start_codon:yes stop_codon:yes gene_type:complete
MAVTLYDASVGRFLQTLGAVEGYLEKGLDHCQDNNIALDEIVETRLYPDMLPFRFQVIQVASHSLSAIKGVQKGEYMPGPAATDLDYQALQDLVAEARSGLKQIEATTINNLSDSEIKTPWWTFTAEGFLMSFSLPSFYFHVTTAYDILRFKGVPVGKLDYLGEINFLDKASKKS